MFARYSPENIRNKFIEGSLGVGSVLHGISTNSRRVANIFKDTMQYDILDVIRDDDGNMLTLQMNCASKNILLINAYGPNIDNPTFFQMVKRQINTIDHDYFILCGDLLL